MSGEAPYLHNYLYFFIFTETLLEYASSVDQKNAASPEAESIFAQAEILVLKDESHLQAEER